MSGMARGVSQCDHSAEGRAQDERAGDVQNVAERTHVIAPLRKVPSSLGTILAATVASVIEKNDLGDVGQSRVCRLVDRVVEAGPAMKEEQCRLFPHGRTMRDQFGALDVEEQPHPVDAYVHGQTPCEQVAIEVAGLAA